MWTKILDRAIDIILVKYPARTSLGVVFGGVLHFLVQLFAPSLSSFKSVDFANSPLWGWLLVGILLMHIPTVISSLRQKQIGDEKIDQALELIERGDFTKAEKRQQYPKLIE